MEDSSIYAPNTYDSSSIGSSGDAGMVAVLLGVTAVITILAYIIGAIFMGMMFKKAGIPAWKAWVPVYNTWTFLEMGGQKGWLSLLILTAVVPFLNFITLSVLTVFMCIAAYRIGLNFGKEGWFVVLYIFVGIVWMIWLAVDKTAVWKTAVAPVANDTIPPATPPSQPVTM